MNIIQKSINQINLRAKTIISPSVRYEIKLIKRRFSRVFSSLLFWKWRSFKFPLNESNLTTIHFLGRPENKLALMALLGINPSAMSSPVNINKHSDIAFASEFPMRDALAIPLCLTTIVKLNRPIEEIMANYSRSLRRSITGQRPNFHYETVQDISKINAIESEMLRPYAIARHDIGASQLDSSIVRKLAQNEFGRLDLLFSGNEPVGCHLGNSYMRNGKRYWHVNRFGYPFEIFSNYKLWGEINSINLHLALEAAIDNNYDYCDYGMSLAKPGAGLIEWKRRRKGFLATYDDISYIYLKLPRKGAAQFLWDSPLFAVEGGKITLHLGIPADKTEKEITAHYHEMGYGGLYKVYLQCITPPDQQLIESIRSLYADQESQPLVITYMVK